MVLSLGITPPLTTRDKELDYVIEDKSRALGSKPIETTPRNWEKRDWDDVIETAPRDSEKQLQELQFDWNSK